MKSKNIKIKSATLITAAIFASNGTLIFADNIDIKKDETVYSILDENGNIKENIVSTWIKSNSKLGKINDISELKNIKNLKGDETPQINGVNITWDIDKDDLYYSGESSKSLPIDLKIKYELNGKTVNPDDIKNKSGKLKITISLKNNEARNVKINGENRTMYVPFLTAVELLMPRDNFKDINISSGTILDEGKNCSITSVSVPGFKNSLKLNNSLNEVIGLEDNLVIEAESTNFEIPSILAIASSNVFKFDKLNEDSSVSDLKSSLGDLQKGVEELLAGSEKLFEGTSELNKNYQLFNLGVKNLDNGVNNLNNGVSKLNNSTPELTKGAKDLNNGLSKLSISQGQFSQGVKSLDIGANKLDEGISNLGSSMPVLSQGASDLNNGLSELSLSQGNLSQGISKYVGNISQLYNKYLDINNGINSVYSGSKDLVNGLSQGNQGINDLIGYSKSTSGIADNIVSIASIVEDENLKNQLLEISKGLGSISSYQQQGLNILSSKINDLYKGALILNEGLNSISLGSTSFYDSLYKISSLGSDLDRNASKIKSATDTIYTGSNILLEGINKVDKGTIELSKGSSELKVGVSQISENSNKLKAATDTIYNGSGALLGGTEKLNAGITQLSQGSIQLKKGTEELRSNSTKILKDTEDINNGANELYKGTKKLKTEGLDRLYDLGSEKLSEIDGLLESIDKLVEISKGYDNYGGINEDMEGSVKFIMKVDSSSYDTTHDLENQKLESNTDEKGRSGFINWFKEILKKY